jgi:hypothetical protein
MKARRHLGAIREKDHLIHHAMILKFKMAELPDRKCRRSETEQSGSAAAG